MKKYLILLCIILSSCFYGCSIFGHISDETDMKIAFLQSIVDNPEQIDSIMVNSVYYHKDRKIFGLNDIRLNLIKHKGTKLNLYLNYKGEAWSYQLSEEPYLIKHQKIGALINDSDMGLFAGFQLIDNKWYIDDIYYISKEQMDNFEEPRDLMPTINR